MQRKQMDRLKPSCFLADAPSLPPLSLYEAEESCLRPHKPKIPLGGSGFHLWLTCTCLTSHTRGSEL